MVAICATHGIFHRAFVNGVHNAVHCATDQATIPICHHTLAFSSGVCRFVIVFRACHIGVCSTLALCSGVSFSFPCDCLYRSTAQKASFFHRLPNQATDCQIPDHKSVIKLPLSIATLSLYSGYFFIIASASVLLSLSLYSGYFSLILLAKSSIDSFLTGSLHVAGIALGSDCNSFALVPISCGVAHHKIGLEMILAAQKGDEIPPIFATGGAIFVEMACGCCFGTFNEGLATACVLSEAGIAFFAVCNAKSAGSIDCFAITV